MTDQNCHVCKPVVDVSYRTDRTIGMSHPLIEKERHRELMTQFMETLDRVIAACGLPEALGGRVTMLCWRGSADIEIMVGDQVAGRVWIEFGEAKITIHHEVKAFVDTPV